MSQPLQEPLLKWIAQGEFIRAHVFTPVRTIMPGLINL